MMIRLAPALIMILFAGNSFAANTRFSIGTSLVYTNINDPNYKYVSEYEQIRNPRNLPINLGISKEFENRLNIGAYTNRLFNPSDSRAVVNKKSGLSFENKTKIRADSFWIGYREQKIMPALFVANTKVEKSLFYKGSFVAKQTNNALLYGISVTYFLDKNINTSLFCIAPNKELNLEGGMGVGINYLF